MRRRPPADRLPLHLMSWVKGADVPKASLDVPANQGAPIPRARTEASFTSSAPKWWSLSVAERLIAENIDGRESTVLFLNCSCVQNVSKMEVSLGIHQDLLFLLISTGLEAGSFTLERGF